MIISFDVTTPIMWWKQMDRYSVGKTQMSESTMHTLMNSLVTVDDFATDGIREKITVNIPDNTYQIEYEETIKNITHSINSLINIYKELKNNVSSDPQKANKLKEIERMVELILPESYLQKRTITMNYTVFRHIYYDRYYKPHKMLEWRQFCEQMLDKLSYIEFIDEKLKLAEERNDLLSKLTNKRMEVSSLERKIDDINEKLNEEEN
jgi:thymidylate synthase ThyX